MTTSELTLAAEFPDGTREQWLALVDKVLKGADFERKLVSTTYDGIAIQPLYTPADRPAAEQFPGQGNLTRGIGTERGDLPWGIAQTQLHPIVAEANRQVIEDLEGGANSLALRLDIAGAGAVDGIVIGSPDEFAAVLEGVYLDLIAISLEAGPHAGQAAELLLSLYDVKGIAPADRSGTLGLDPLGALAATGELPQGLDAALAELRDVASRTVEAKNLRTVNVDTAAVVDAGASAVEELAVAIATAVDYVRVLADGDLAAAFGEIAFTLQADADVFAGIAKFRAARRLWAHVANSAGVDAASLATPFAARTATRMMSQRDPWVNMLRTTAASFAAGVGGASSVTVQPFDVALGLPDGLARRIARNTQLILQEESNLGAVIDPAGGSNYIESLTTQFAERAWARFQEIEAAGGYGAVLTSGAEHQVLTTIREARLANIAKRKDPLTGVSEFPNIAETLLERETVDLVALRSAASAFAAPVSGPATTIEALPAVRDGSQFEALRDASDRALAQNGARPSIFLANLGPIATHTARATYAKNFFEAGGVQAVGDVGFDDAAAVAAAFTASGLTSAVICSSDAVYAERAADTAAALKAAGAKRVYLAGHPGEARADYEAAGVDEFVYVGANVLDVLTRLLTLEGVQ